MKIWFHTFGCRVNQYETESLKAALIPSGARSAADYRDADVCVINTCSVTAAADRDALRLLRRITRDNPVSRLIVTGCLATRDPGAVMDAAPQAETVGNKDKNLIPALLGCRTAPGLTRPFADRSRAFIKIQDGCNMHCSFCVIPALRPKLYSRPLFEIQAEIASLVTAGVPEVVLCGIRLGRYLVEDSAGRRVDLVGLLERVLEHPGEFRVRLSSLEITDATDRLFELMASSAGRLCPYLHLPLQSGSESVLRRMQRWYSAAFYRRRTQALREVLPQAGLFADVIVGFPGESDEEFAETVSFIEELRFSGLHVFRYSRRSGTAAAGMREPLPEAVVRQRADILRGMDAGLRRDFSRKAVGSHRRIVAELSRPVGLAEDFLEVSLEGHPGPGLHRVQVVSARDSSVLGVLDPEVS